MGLKKQFKKNKIASPAIRRILGGGKMRQKLFYTSPENIYKSFTPFSSNYKSISDSNHKLCKNSEF
jgi:hypothetical protein